MKRFVILAALLFPAGAVAQSNCHSRDLVLSRLADRYGESRQAIGLAANGTVVEIFASETGSWTITVTAPGGPMCLVAAGEGYQALSETVIPGVDG